MESEGKIEKLIKIIVTKNVPLIVRLSGSFKWKMYIWNSLLKLMTACDVLPKSVLQAICHNLSLEGRGPYDLALPHGIWHTAAQG